jgi:hypothetical protein
MDAIQRNTENPPHVDVVQPIYVEFAKLYPVSPKHSGIAFLTPGKRTRFDMVFNLVECPDFSVPV